MNKNGKKPPGRTQSGNIDNTKIKKIKAFINEKRYL